MQRTSIIVLVQEQNQLSKYAANFRNPAAIWNITTLNQMLVDMTSAMSWVW
jgi:hypothetical protein